MNNKKVEPKTVRRKISSLEATKLCKSIGVPFKPATWDTIGFSEIRSVMVLKSSLKSYASYIKKILKCVYHIAEDNRWKCNKHGRMELGPTLLLITGPAKQNDRNITSKSSRP